jgi:hypothetical protein
VSQVGFFLQIGDFERRNLEIPPAGWAAEDKKSSAPPDDKQLNRIGRIQFRKRDDIASSVAPEASTVQKVHDVIPKLWKRHGCHFERKPRTTTAVGRCATSGKRLALHKSVHENLVHVRRECK